MKRKPIRVSFQGEKGAFSQVAVRQLLGDDAEVNPCTWFDEVFRSLADKRVDAAVIPIENTLVGSIHENYDNLLEYNLPIVAETNVRIVHNLIGPPNVPLKKVRKVYSHPVALNQCLKFFASHPELERISFYDTAGSVKMLMEENRTDAAAIASSVAAEMYGARILKRSIEDDRENFTRFFLLRRPNARGASNHGPQDGKAWKTSLVFTTAKNLPGSLFRSLSAFALRDLSLTKIESRPLRGKPFEYLFYMDFLGHIEDQKCRNALAHLTEMADFVRVLGCYPCGA